MALSGMAGDHVVAHVVLSRVPQGGSAAGVTRLRSPEWPTGPLEFFDEPQPL